MTKFKDVAHMYSNKDIPVIREPLFEGDKPEQTTIIEIKGMPIVRVNRFPGMSTMGWDQIKPILRPLSTMTDQENKELFNGNFVNDGLFTPHEFIALLSAGFDLFGLIESGHAIDAATA